MIYYEMHFRMVLTMVANLIHIADLAAADRSSGLPHADPSVCLNVIWICNVHRRPMQSVLNKKTWIFQITQQAHTVQSTLAKR